MDAGAAPQLREGPATASADARVLRRESKAQVRLDKTNEKPPPSAARRRSVWRRCPPPSTAAPFSKLKCIV